MLVKTNLFIFWLFISLLFIGTAAGQHFEFQPTEDYYPIIIANATLNGQAIEDGDEIGVFFRDDNNNLVCAGATIWPTSGFEAWGDDSQTSSKDGFSNGEALYFILWDASEQTEIGPPDNVTYLSGDGNWGTGPFAQISLLEFTGIVPALTVDPSNRDVGYTAGQTSFEVTSNVSWTVSESVSWLSVSPTSGSDDGTLTVSYDENSSSSERTGTISVSGDGITRNVTVTQAEAQGHFTYTPTEDYYPIIINNVTRDGQNIENGDEIGVFFRDDNNNLVCAGATIWPTSGFEAWGDDSQTSSKDGFSNGEALYFILWDASAQEEVHPPANVTYTSGDGDWGTGPFAQISLMEFIDEYLTVTPANRDVTSEAGQTTFDVSSNISWTVSESVDWLSVSPTDGSDDGTLTVTYDENTSTSERQGTISVSGSGITRNVTVTQAEAEPHLTVTPANRDVGSAAGQTSFEVTSNVSWTVNESVSWLSVSPTSGSDDGTLTVSYDENSSSSERTGTISVSGDGITRNVTVTQAEAQGHFTYTPTEDYYPIIIDNVTRDGQTIENGDEIGVFFRDDNNNLVCAGATIWPTSGFEAWGDDSQTSSKDGFSNGEALYFILWDASAQEEVHPPANVTYTSGDGDWGTGPFAQISLMEFIDEYLTVTPANRDVTSEAGQTTFDVSSNISWTVSESVGWLSVSPTDGSDDGTLTVTYDENTSTSERQGTISVSGSGITRNVTVTQAEAEPHLTVTPANRDVGSAAGQTSFEVTSNVSWTVNESVSWLSVSPSSGSDDGTLTVTYNENTTSSERVGTISVSGEGITRNVTVTQAESQGHFTFTPTEDYYPIIIDNVTRDGQTIENGDEIGVFFRDDNNNLVCAGATIWPTSGFEAWGDDSQTSSKDGFSNGEALYFILWDASAQEEVHPPANVTYTSGDGDWGTGPFAQISLMEFIDEYLTVSPPNRDVTSEAGQTTFDVSSNISWTVSESVGWLSVSPTSGSDDGTLTVTYDENTSTSERVGTISVTGSGITQNVTVTQAEAEPLLIVTPSNQDVGYAVGQTTFAISSNISWTVSESVGWLSVSPTSGSADGTLTVTYDENTSTSERIGTISVSGSGIIRQVTVTQAEAEPRLTVTPSNQDVGYAAGQTSFEVTSNISWTVNESVSWLSVSPAGGSDDGTLTVTYDENTTSSERVGTISVSGSGITRNVTVTQEGAPASLTVDPSNRDVGYASGQTTFDVISNISWTVSESVGWLSVSPTGGSDDGTLTVTYDENSSTSERVGTISVSGGGITRNVTVTQAGSPAILSVDPSNRDVGYASGQTIFDVTSNISWTVSESVSWLSVSPTDGSDDGTLTVTYDENTSTSERVGTISVSGSGITRNVTVTQAGAPANLTVDPSNRDVSNAAGQTTLDVSSNISWTVSESVSWLSVSPTDGSDDGTLTVNYDENTSTSERVGTISVSGSGITRNVTVTQAGAAANLTVDPSNRDVSNAAGQTTFNITSNISWTVSESVGWLSVSPTDGSDDGTLTVTYDENTSTSERVGTISVSGSGITRNVTVTQAGAAPNLTVDPSNRDVSNAAGQTTFNVASNISWTVSESVGWLSVSPTSGSGDGILTVDYEANPSTGQRIGIITVSGDGFTREVTVTQLGAAASLTVDPSNRDVGYAAGQASFDVTSNISWTVSESVGWLSVSPTSGSGDGTLTVTYDENSSTTERIGTISVSGSGITREVTVTQVEAAASLTVDPSNRDVGYASGQTTFDVSSNISWTVSESVGWLSLSPTSGSDDGTLTVTYDENTSTSERVGTISVSGSGITRNVTVTQAGAAANLTVDPSNRDVGYAAGQSSFAVTSNISWTVSESVSWLSVSPTSGSEDGTLTVTYDANSSSSERTGTIGISGDGITRNVTVTQEDAPAHLTVDPSNRDVGYAAGQTTFDVSSNISWTVSESVGWLSVSPTSGSDDGTLTATYDENTSTSERVGTISVSGSGITRNVTVTQAEAAPNLTVDPSNRDVSNAAGQTTYSVNSNISWTVSESVGWLSVSPTNGNDDGTLTVTFEANPSTGQRVGTISVSGNGLTRNVTVTQLGSAASLSVTPLNRDVGYEAGQSSFEVISNISWTVSESVGWLSVSPTNGSGDGTLTVTYDGNTSTSERVGTISVSGSGITREVTVTQAGAAAHLTVDPSNRDVSNAAGQTTFDVTSNISWIVSESVDWLSVSPTDGSDDGTLTVTYGENTSTSERVGTISLSGSGITRNVTVTQLGSAASLTVTPSNRDVGYEAGQSSFEVSSNISWIVSERVEWLSVDPMSGNGDGSLIVDFEENKETENREGVITVSGGGIERHVSINQMAAPMLTVTPTICSIGSESCDTILVVKSNIDWLIEINEIWVSVTPTSGSGNDTLQVHIEENSEVSPRTAILTITGSGLSVDVDFEQDGVTGIADNEIGLPSDFILEQNYPNPFNPSTTIRFSLPKKSDVILELYNSSGQIINILVNNNLNAGYHSIVWNASHLSSGTYFCRLKTKEFQGIVKMMLVK